MDINNMRNIVVLKDLPSNLVEEAFVVLKDNQRVKKLEYVENNLDNFVEDKIRENEDEYVIKEAELLVANYISRLENQDLNGKKRESDLVKKYKKLKRFAIMMVSCLVALSFLYIIKM